MPTSTPDSLPNPVDSYLATLNIPAPTALHPASFFDPPDSSTSRLGPVIRKARAFIHDLLPNWAENHVYRTYAFALAIADIAGWSKAGADSQRLGWDKELWFLTAILHDIGWDAEEDLKSRLSFEIFGGVKARELLMKWGASQDEADEVCESIIRHTDLTATTGSIRLMGALTQIGARQDLLGFAVPSLLHPEDNILICKRWPRVGVIRLSSDHLSQEIKCKPGCITTKWIDAVVPAMQKAVLFKDLEGEPVEDDGWRERRKALPPY